VNVAFVGGVDEAMQLLSGQQPRLIISEFRMPTMAAKRLVDTLRDSGKSIPVLVTTSQTGKTADMLVEKLGVAGYLSKPLSSDEVSSQLSCFLGRSPA
jgi:CheY-like chemotaxis protein